MNFPVSQGKLDEFYSFRSCMTVNEISAWSERMTGSHLYEGRTPEITEEILEQLIKLAQFDLTPSRKEYLRKELNKQREALAKIDEAISEIESDGIDLGMMTHATVYTDTNRPPLREDEVKSFTDIEALLRNAPLMDDGHFVVPGQFSADAG